MEGSREWAEEQAAQQAEESRKRGLEQLQQIVEPEILEAAEDLAQQVAGIQDAKAFAAPPPGFDYDDSEHRLDPEPEGTPYPAWWDDIDAPSDLFPREAGYMSDDGD